MERQKYVLGPMSAKGASFHIPICSRAVVRITNTYTTASKTISTQNSEYIRVIRIAEGAAVHERSQRIVDISRAAAF